jgi:GT2 family glycosyltransferase
MTDLLTAPAARPFPLVRPRVARRAVIDVDVVIVGYRSRDLVMACLDSLPAAADGAVVSVTVVDNGSGDGTYEDVAARGDGTRVIDMEFDTGFATAANAGMARGRGRYILILDQDTIMTPGSLRSLVEFADRHPDGGAFAPRLLDGQGSPSTPDAGDEPAFEIDWVPARAMLVPRAVHAATAGFDEGYLDFWGDRDWSRRIKNAGYSLYCVSTATAICQDPSPADRSQQLAAIRSYHAGAYRYWLQHEAPPRWHPAHWVQAFLLAARGQLALLTSKAPPTA